jgi:PKD repeat protein
MRLQDRGVSPLFLTIFLLAAAAPAWATGTPAVPVPPDRWGTLQPVGILNDTTSFEGHTIPHDGNTRRFYDVDIENGYLFTTTGQGFAIFDLHASPAPTLPVSYIYGWIHGGAFPVWHFSDKTWYIRELDAPNGYDGLVALGMDEQGFAVINTTAKAAPVMAYQGELDVTRVYAFTSGAQHFAYALGAQNGAIYRFSLSAAEGMNKCVEAPPATIACPGVYLGAIASFGSSGNVEIQGTGGFVVLSSAGRTTGRTRLYSIADPAAPALRMEIPDATFSAVLWQQGSSTFLARLAVTGQISIYDVSCIAAGSCTAPAPLWTGTPAAPQPLQYLKISVDSGRPYLYVGGEDQGSCVPQREYLYDLGNPAQPVELTPQAAAGPYWGWYYMNCPTGFNLVGPRRGRVYNGVLYRAAISLLDSHRITNVDPKPRVDAVAVSPSNPVVCQPVTFTAINATGQPPLTYSWTLVDAGSNPVPGVSSNTGVLTWNTTPTTPPGAYTATVTVTNTLGSASKGATMSLSALPALPPAGSFTPTTDPFTGSTVTFHVSVAGATSWNWDFDGDGVFNEADWTSDPVAGPNPTFTYTSPGTRQVRVKVRNCVSPAGVVSAPVPVAVVGFGKIFVNGPDVGPPNQSLQFSATGTDSCVPAANGWTWTTVGGVISGQPGATVTISWNTLGTKTVTAKNSACPSISGTKQVKINPPLKACFTSSPADKLAAQPVSFDGACSVGTPTSYAWDFGDNTPPGSGVQTSHTYAKPGTYQVTLSVTRLGSDCPPAPFCENSKPDLIEVRSPLPPLVAKFMTSAACATQDECDAETGQAITFTDQSEGGPDSRSWSFGDGGTATGPAPVHTFTQPGTYTVTLKVSRGSESASTPKTFQVTRRASAVVVPWVARSRGTAVQTSDLYVTNPGTAPMTVTLEFRRRGSPDPAPPRVVRTIAPGATLYAADCIKSLFGRDESTSGFVLVTPAPGSPQPVATSQQTSGATGSVFGLAVQGVAVTPAGSGLQLAGMNDNSARTAFFGVTNPNDAPATYRLRFFDAAGQAIGTASGDLTLSRFGQRQFQLGEIRTLFGISNQADYRVVADSTAGPLFPFGVNAWAATNDPSLAGNGPSGSGRAWLIGVSNKPGADGTAWKSDLILASTGSQAAAVNLTFTPLGVGAPTAPSKVSLSPGATTRLADVLKKQWNLTNQVGVVAIEGDPAGSAPPAGLVAFGDSYRSPLLGKRYGHSMASMSEGDAAGPGRVHVLAGLRQDAQSKTTIWVLDAGAETLDCDVIYRGLDGAELGRIVVKLAPGRVRQIGPTQHPLPEGGVADGFTVTIQVRTGKVLGAAQVVNNTSGESAYVRGVTP